MFLLLYSFWHINKFTSTKFQNNLGFYSLSNVFSYFFFIIKPLVGETLIEIESAVAKHKKSAILFLSNHSPSDNGVFKNHRQRDI